MATVRFDETAEALQVHLGGVLDIYAAREARAALAPALTTTRPAVRLELAGIEELDLAGVQLLLWLRGSVEANGLAVELGTRSDAVASAARSLHLTTLGATP